MPVEKIYPKVKAKHTHSGEECTTHPNTALSFQGNHCACIHVLALTYAWFLKDGMPVILSSSLYSVLHCKSSASMEGRNERKKACTNNFSSDVVQKKSILSLILSHYQTTSPHLCTMFTERSHNNVQKKNKKRKLHRVLTRQIVKFNCCNVIILFLLHLVHLRCEH